MTDNLPAELTNVSITPCGSFPCYLGTLAVNQSVLITVTGTVAQSAIGVITNTAAVTSPVTPEPPTSTVTTTLTPLADLQITKTGPLTDTPGTSISYQLVVFNAGPSDAPDATVSDAFPAELPAGNLSWTCVSSLGACNNAAGSGTLNVVEDISAGERMTYSITAMISTSATGVLTNTAVVTPPLTVTDPVTENNTSTVTTTLAAEAVLQIKKLGPATAVPGTKITYTIAGDERRPKRGIGGHHHRPDARRPHNRSVVSAPCAAGFPCVLNSGLAVNASVLLTVSFDVDANAVGLITNTATVTSPETPEPPTSTVTTTLTPEANLQIKKLGPATAVPGTRITYTIAGDQCRPVGSINHHHHRPDAGRPEQRGGVSAVRSGLPVRHPNRLGGQRLGAAHRLLRCRCQRRRPHHQHRHRHLARDA